MAVLYITEYANQPLDRNGIMIAAGHEPGLATQTVSIGAGSLQSSAFNAKTKFIRVHTDAICSIAFGTNPTATTSTARMAANTTEFFGVVVDKSHKIAVIANT